MSPNTGYKITIVWLILVVLKSEHRLQDNNSLVNVGCPEVRTQVTR